MSNSTSAFKVLDLGPAIRDVQGETSNYSKKEHVPMRIWQLLSRSSKVLVEEGGIVMGHPVNMVYVQYRFKTFFT